MDPSNPPWSENFDLEPGFWYTIEISSQTKDELAVDFDGDHKQDVAIYRPSNGGWRIKPSSGGSTYVVWYGGLATDVPVSGDYDGDGKTDVAIFRNGGWHIKPASGASAYYVWYGLGTDVPVPGDYDGDGKTDIAVYRPSNGVWYIMKSSGGIAHANLGGVANDIPVNPVAVIYMKYM